MGTLTSDYQYIGRSNAVFNYAGTYYYYLLLYAKTSGSAVTGKHTVTLKMRLACQVGVHFYGYSTTGNASVAGQNCISWSAQRNPNSEWNKDLTEDGVTYPRWIDLGEGSTDVYIGYGTTKDVALAASFQRLDLSSPPDYVPKTAVMRVDATVTLPAINGASVPTLSVPTVPMGTAVTVKTNRKSTSLTHTITYAFGSASGIIGTDVSDSISWTPSLDLAKQIINTTKGTGTIYCTTYSGSAKVGDTQSVTITLKVPDNDSTKPKVSLALSPVSSLADPFNALYIQNLTKLGADLSAEGQYGATILAYETLVGGSEYSGGYLTRTGEVAVTGKAADSRGYVGSTEQTITVIPYEKPAIVPAEGQTDIVCARCDKSGEFTDSGTYLRIIAKRIYSPVVSNSVQYNFCQLRYRVDDGSWKPLLDGNAAGDEIDTGAIGGVVGLTNASYSIEIGVVDTIGNTASVTKIVPTEQVEFHMRFGGNGAAFGEYAENEKELSIAADWTLNIKGRVVGAIFDAIYPVNSIYLSYSHQNPADLFGGIWERLENAFLWACGVADTIGATGGEKTHTLTVSELPSHGHSLQHSTDGGNTWQESDGVLGRDGDFFTDESYMGTSDSVAAYAQWRGRVGPTGGGAAHNNMPPYIQVSVWRRTA